MAHKAIVISSISIGLLTALVVYQLFTRDTKSQQTSKQNPKKKVIQSPKKKLITVKYNKLGSRAFTQEMRDIDTSITIGELRRMIAKKIELNEIVLHANQEIRAGEDSNLLWNYVCSNNSFVLSFHIEKGKPLKHDEYRFAIYVEDKLTQRKTVYGYIRYYYHCNSENTNKIFHFLPVPLQHLIFKYYFIRKRAEPMQYIGHLKLAKSMSTKQIKQYICDTFGDGVPQPAARMRLRQTFTAYCVRDKNVQNDVLSAVYCDSLNLETNCKRIYGKMQNMIQICCQQLDKTEYITDDQMLLNCAKCYKIKSKWIIEEFVEVLFPKHCEGSMIKSIIHEEIANDIDPNNIMVQGHIMQDFEPHQLSKYMTTNRRSWSGSISRWFKDEDWLGTKVSDHYRLKTGDILLYAHKKDINRQ